MKLKLFYWQRTFLLELMKLKVSCHTCITTGEISSCSEAEIKIQFFIHRFSVVLYGGRMYYTKNCPYLFCFQIDIVLLIILQWW